MICNLFILPFTKTSPPYRVTQILLYRMSQGLSAIRFCSTHKKVTLLGLFRQVDIPIPRAATLWLGPLCTYSSRYRYPLCTPGGFSRWCRLLEVTPTTLKYGGHPNKRDASNEKDVPFIRQNCGENKEDTLRILQRRF